MSKKRVNKTKKEVISEIQLASDAERRRSLIRDVIFPHLVEMSEDIQFSKIYLQSVAGMIETVYEEERKRMTVGDLDVRIQDKLDKYFDKNPKERERYSGLINKLKEVSVQDFAYAAELVRYIDGYIIKSKGKESISTIPIDEILG